MTPLENPNKIVKLSPVVLASGGPSSNWIQHKPIDPGCLVKPHVVLVINQQAQQKQKESADISAIKLQFHLEISWKKKTKKEQNIIQSHLFRNQKSNSKCHVVSINGLEAHSEQHILHPNPADQTQSLTSLGSWELHPGGFPATK